MQWLIDIILDLCKAYTDQAILDAKVIPPGTIIGWWGLYDDHPVGWEICDGTEGTPDLRSRFLRSSGSGIGVMAFGGSNTHTHGTGAGLATGKAKTSTSNNVPEFAAMWWIIKL